MERGWGNKVEKISFLNYLFQKTESKGLWSSMSREAPNGGSIPSLVEIIILGLKKF